MKTNKWLLILTCLALLIPIGCNEDSDSDSGTNNDTDSSEAHDSDSTSGEDTDSNQNEDSDSITEDDSDSATEEDSDTAQQALVIIGDYTDSYGTAYSITEDIWTTTFTGFDPTPATIKSFDNNAMIVIAQNADETWARYDWFFDGDDLYYCQIEYAADDEQTAKDNDNADSSALATDGCAGFTWTSLTPAE